MVGDTAENCIMALFSDASFAGDLKDSKSTSGAFLALVGPRTFVPITWMCKKQTAVSHSSTEAEIVSLDAGMRMEGLPSTMLWDEVIKIMSPKAKAIGKFMKQKDPREATSLLEYLESVDFVPPSIPDQDPRTRLLLLEDNDAVIKIIIKGRSPQLRHVGRTHRIDTDWLNERIREDPAVRLRYVNTKRQMADILTKGTFVSSQWHDLCELIGITDPMKSTQPKISNKNSIRRIQIHGS